MLIPAVVILLSLFSAAQATSSSGACVDCHAKQTPNIVADWKQSRHSEIGVSCDTCHGNAHMSAADAAKAKIPTPETCAQCHEQQVAQFKKGKHSMAWAAMEAMPTIHYQPMAQTEGMKGCGSCHKLGLKSPNQIASLAQQGNRFGVASCDACHTRHTFSVAEARQPQVDYSMWYGWSEMQRDLTEIKEMAAEIRTTGHAPEPVSVSPVTSQFGQKAVPGQNAPAPERWR